MKINNFIRNLIVALVIFGCTVTINFAQTAQKTDKLLFQIDRDIYIAGEDVLVNAFLLSKDNDYISKVLYVEVYDEENNVIQQAKFEINKGVASGHITLPESVPTHTYSIRAYKNSWKNYSPEIYPTKIFTVINPNVPVKITKSKEVRVEIDTSATEIQLSQNSSHFTFKVINVKNPNGLRIQVYSDNFQQISILPLPPSLQIDVSKIDMPSGLLYLALYNEDEKLLMIRPFYNWPKEEALDVNLPKSIYKPREKVEFTINNKNMFNSVSVSVVKKGTVNYNTISKNILNNINLLSTFLYENHSLVGHLKDTIDFYLEKAGTKLLSVGNFSELVEQSRVSDIKYSDEIIGPSLTGKISTIDGEPLSDSKMFLSVFDGKKQFHSTISDSLGIFSFSLYPKTYGTNRLMVRSEADDSLKSKIFLDYDYSNKYVKNQIRIDIDSTDRGLLEDLYVNYQVNKRINKYKETYSNDSLFNMFGEPNYSIKLNDYINLPKLEEVFSEIIPYVSVKKNNGKPFVSVFNDKLEIFYNSPLVLLDFIPVYNIEELLNVKPSSLSRIDVINRTYRLGEFTYHGIVSITSKKNNFAEYPFPKDAVFLDFESVSFLYDFNHVNYDDSKENLSRTPDFRTVLFWELSVESGNISFFTSDYCSEYQAVITSIDKNGNIVKTIQDFVVKQ